MNFNYFSTLILILLTNTPVNGMLREYQILKIRSTLFKGSSLRSLSALFKPIPTRTLSTSSHYKPKLKRTVFLIGGLATLGGAEYVQAFKENQKRTIEIGERIFYASLEPERKHSSFADIFSEKPSKLPHDVFEEAKTIWTQLAPDLPITGFCHDHIDSPCSIASTEIANRNNSWRLVFPQIHIDPTWWRSASEEEKKTLLARQYGHWCYWRKHGFDLPPSKAQEEFCDKVAVNKTGSAKGIIKLTQRPELCGFSFESNSDVKNMSSAEDNDSLTRKVYPYQPFPPLRAALAIQHEKRLGEQAHLDDVVVPSLTSS